MLAGIVLASGLFAPSPSLPPTRPVADAVIVHPGGSCLEPAEVAKQVEGALDYVDVDTRISVVLSATLTTAEFTVLELGKPVATRTFPSLPEDCTEQHAALGLAIAVAIDAAILEATQPEPEPEPEPETAPLPYTPTELTAPSSEPGPVPPVPTHTTDVILTASGVGAAGVPATIGFGGRLDLDVGPLSWLLLRASGLTVFAPSFAIGTGRANVLVVAGAASLCPRRQVNVVELALCAGMQVGAVRASGRDVIGARTDAVAYAAADTGLFAHLFPREGRIGLLVGASLVVPVTRTTLSIPGAEGVSSRSLPPAGGMLTFGVRFSLRRGPGPRKN